MDVLELEVMEVRDGHGAAKSSRRRASFDFAKPRPERAR